MFSIVDNLRKKIKENKIKNQLTNHNYIVAAQKARNWVNRNTIQGHGIVITSKQRSIYQEVTGYYIPTLLQWGMRDEAIAYTRYLCNIQEDNGAWLSFDQIRPSVFNTGQVLRGLIAMVDVYPQAYGSLIKGCEWLITNINEEGCLVATKGTKWSIGFNSELIHLYCLPPLLEAGKKYDREDFVEAVSKVKKYYIENYRKDIDDFNYLSHFYAYVIEALVDLGEIEIARESMRKMQEIQRIDGMVPGFKNCGWTCSTGLFQLALIWFKLGDWKHGNKTFDYAVSLQNKSGGWYGGYVAPLRLPNGKKIPTPVAEEITYFPNEEISWAVKYFFDALYYRGKVEFEQKAHTFIKHIDSNENKYQTVYSELKRLERKNKDILKVADIGCGKGRYLKKMLLSSPQNEYYGIDLSETILSYVANPKINLSSGNILNTGSSNQEYDLVYATESVEHAIFIDLAVKEMCRITKRGGSIVIIDKDRTAFDSMKYKDWIIPEELSTKQWLDTDEMIGIYKYNDLIDIEVLDVYSTEGRMYKAYIGRKAE